MTQKKKAVHIDLGYVGKERLHGMIWARHEREAHRVPRHYVIWFLPNGNFRLGDAFTPYRAGEKLHTLDMQDMEILGKLSRAAVKWQKENGGGLTP